jgi:hypothetical protein
VANGDVPKWDSVTGGYVYGDPSSNEESIGGGTNQSYEDPQANEESDDDMPF